MPVEPFCDAEHKPHLKDAEVAHLERDTLHECEEQYRRLLDEVKDYAIFTLDPKGTVVSWNVGAERIKGYGWNRNPKWARPSILLFQIQRRNAENDRHGRAAC